MSEGYSRRELFSLFRRSRKRRREAEASTHPEGGDRSSFTGSNEPMVAIVQGRHCLAPVDGCSICVGSCPVPDAMDIVDGMPFVVPEVCIGCEVCLDACPALPNAILMIPRKPGQTSDPRRSTPPPRGQGF